MRYLTSRGLCGLDLWVQCFAIATIQVVSSFLLLCVSIVRMLRPQLFVDDWAVVATDPHVKNAVLNQNDELAVELIVAAGGTLIASILLIAGLRKKSTTLIYPWIIITFAQLVGGLVLFAVRLHGSRRWTEDNVHTNHISWLRVVAVVIYNLVMIFFLHSVTSYFDVLKREKRAGRRAAMLELSSGYPSSEMITFSVRGSQPVLDLMTAAEDITDASSSGPHSSIIINKGLVPNNRSEAASTNSLNG